MFKGEDLPGGLAQPRAQRRLPVRLQVAVAPEMAETLETLEALEAVESVEVLEVLEVAETPAILVLQAARVALGKPEVVLRVVLPARVTVRDLPLLIRLMVVNHPEQDSRPPQGGSRARGRVTLR